MLHFVGLGLTPHGLSLAAVDLLRRADRIWLEAYTSPLPPTAARQIKRLVRRPIEPVSREFVEDGRAILDAAAKQETALVSPGDPMIATTHQELRIRAVERGIPTRIHCNASVASAVPGALGLHSYKFGKSVTITQSRGTPPTTAYHTITRNLQQGLHTLVLLEYDEATRFAVGPERAVRALRQAEREHRHGVLERGTLIVVASRVGSPTERIEAGPWVEMARRKFGKPPHCIVIPGPLHFTEEAALRVLFGIRAQKPPRVLRPAERLVPRYLLKSRRALARARRRATEAKQPHFATLFENVEAYLSDAERFLGEGRDELAMLSTGYAEGLLDALQYTNQLRIEW